MKKVLIVAMVALAAVSCKDCPDCPERTDCPPVRYTTSSPEIDVAKQLVADYVAGNWDEWLSHYAEDAKLYHNAWGEEDSLEALSGGATAEEMLENLKGTLANMSSYKFKESPVFYEMIEDDNGLTWVYFWGMWTGTLAENDTEILVPVHLALHFEDGKIANEYAFYNMAELLAAMSGEGA